jgi:hypothetical protein
VCINDNRPKKQFAILGLKASAIKVCHKFTMDRQNIQPAQEKPASQNQQQVLQQELLGRNTTGSGGGAPLPTMSTGTSDCYAADVSNDRHGDMIRLLLEQKQNKTGRETENLCIQPADEVTATPAAGNLAAARTTGSATHNNASPLRNSAYAITNYHNFVPFVLQDAKQAEAASSVRWQLEEDEIMARNKIDNSLLSKHYAGDYPSNSKDASTISPSCAEEGGNTTSSTGATSIMSTTSLPPRQKRRRNKKPQTYPSRPLSAYNIFFRDERINILEELKEDEGASKDLESSSSCGEKNDTINVGSSADNESTTDNRTNKSASGVGFENLTKLIAGRWRELTGLKHEHYKKLAKRDKDRYETEVVEYQSEEAKKRKIEQESARIRIQEQQLQARILQDEHYRNFGIAHTNSSGASHNPSIIGRNGSIGWGSTTSSEYHQPRIDPNGFFQATTGRGQYPTNDINNIEEQIFLNIIKEAALTGEMSNPRVLAILRELNFVEEQISKLTRK